jgi:hypothetical protein
MDLGYKSTHSSNRPTSKQGKHSIGKSQIHQLKHISKAKYMGPKFHITDRNKQAQNTHYKSMTAIG